MCDFKLTGNYLDLIKNLDIASILGTKATSPNMKDSSDLKQFEAGIACFLAFVQQNWTGPNLDWNPRELVTSKLVCFDLESALRELEVDGEEFSNLAEHPILLLIAYKILGSKGTFNHVDFYWWRQRVLFVIQKLLENPSETLYNEILASFSKIEPKTPEQEARIHLEKGNVLSYYNKHQQSIDEYTKAQKISGLEWEFTGVLGKRTKFQEYDVSQLVILAKNTKTPIVEQETQSKPKNLNLNDDTLLEKIQISTEMETAQLSALDQSILLSFCLNYKNTNPEDGLITEQMMPFVSVLNIN